MSVMTLTLWETEEEGAELEGEHEEEEECPREAEGGLEVPVPGESTRQL